MCTMEKNVAVSVDLENNETNLVNSLKKMVEDTPLTDSRAQQATIFRVPHHIRNTDPEAYKPKIVSLGPYHHHDRRLQALDDKLKLKWRYLKKFLARNSQKKMEDYLNLVKDLEPQARIAYSEEVNMSSNDFVQMLLLDCCFVIELLLLVRMETEKKHEEEEMQKEKKSPRMTSVKKKQATTEKEDDPILSTWKWAPPLVAHDVLIFENQLPLFVLESLLREIAGQDISMDQLMPSFFPNFHLGSSNREDSKASMKQYHHLLHLFHSCIIPRQKDGGDGGHRVFIAEKPAPVPCARELREARVKLRRKKAKEKEAVSFLDITFTEGRMEIPQLQIDDNTNSLLRNLIAFEQCYLDVGLHVSTYAWFTDSVIDKGKDVALLRKRGIIVSGLGSDVDVALLFNKLCKEVMMDPESSYLGDVFVDVKNHCRKKCNKCCASLKHDYFSNPWVTISVIAAVLLFLLTITQTVFSVVSYVEQ